MNLFSRLLVHQAKVLACLSSSLVGWNTQRVRGSDAAFGYSRIQNPLTYVMLFVVVAEGVVMAVLIPWPVVHAITLAVHGYLVLLVLGLAVAARTRPHLISGDRLRVRYGVGLDVRIPLRLVMSVRAGIQSPDGGTIQLADGVLDVAVAGQINVTIELAEPVSVAPALGSSGSVTCIRIYADEPREFASVIKERMAALV